MQEYLGSRLQLGRGALGSAVIAGGVKMNLLAGGVKMKLGYVGIKAWRKERQRTGSHIC